MPGYLGGVRSSSPIQPLLTLAEQWRASTRGSRWRAAIAVTAMGSSVALLGARSGTPWTRVAAAVVIAATVAFALAWRALEHRRLRDPRRILGGPVGQVDRARAARALRALSLMGPGGDFRAEGTSAELARVHVARALADIPSESVAERAARAARRLGALALAIGACALAVILANRWSVLEGADVLVARRGVAPFPMTWLGDVEVSVRPPEYLHQNPIQGEARSPLRLAHGSVITVRGTLLRPGRRLFLSDGVSEWPFVDDGAGEVVVRYSLDDSRVLRVVARFGDVVIPEAEELAVASILDEAPVVVLDDAPRELRLLGATADIPIKYQATDDHGLREVHLVLRSGTREERRVLARLDGDTTMDRGGHVLKLRDPFLAKSHVPVEITVEAKDNDPLTGPKWGSSAAITVIPPDVGDPEAEELEALRRVRDALVDSLAWRLGQESPTDPAARRALAETDGRRADHDGTLLDQTLSLTLAGVRVPSRVRALLVAQEQATRNAIAAQLRAPSEPSRTDVVKATERFVLVIDAILRGLGVRDARASAMQLADVADDLALGTGQMKNDGANVRSRGLPRVDAAMAVLRAGGKVMTRLGELGRDLGEIVDADLSRVARARGDGDLSHAELAARDLAARLRQPDPSFGERGGSRRAGGESGGAQGTPGDVDEGAPSDEVEQAFEEAAQDLERLSQEHSGEIAKMEQAIAGATSEDERQQMRDEGKQHADAIREAARRLPAVGMGSDSWTSKGAAARDLAQQMARSLEEGQPDSAVQSGRSALGSLDEAKKMFQRGGWMDDPSGEQQRRVDDVRRKLDGEERWAEEQLGARRKRATERARGQLRQGGEDEDKLADRARDLARKGRAAGALPEQATDSIEEAERAARQAADALGRGDADEGLERQREAQRDLEAAREQLRGDEDDSQRSGDSGDGRGATRDPVAIPNANDHKGPEEFRRRVLRGLGTASTGALRDAVQRYAEGLLR